MLFHFVPRWGFVVAVYFGLLCCGFSASAQTNDLETSEFERRFSEDVVPLISQFCGDCHGAELSEAEIDFTNYRSLQDARHALEIWQKVSNVLSSGEMPPVDAPQPDEAQQQRLRQVVDGLLAREAERLAGDPGPIVLRRLSNAEYTNSVRQLTGLPMLAPAREFPVDGASGEGFTNAGNALVMSPALLTKYLDAGKEIAQHVVLTPSGIRFSPSVYRRDWTEETLAAIRELYAKHTAAEGGSEVNLQGIVFNTNDGGRLPIRQYLLATIEERASLSGDVSQFERVAVERGISPKYLRKLWQGLSEPEGLLMEQLAGQWRMAEASDVPQLVSYIQNWQQALWKFSSVGHIGKVNGPKAWMEPISPLANRQEYRIPAADLAPGNDEVVIYLSAGDAGDGEEHDEVCWERPRFVAAGRPDMYLRDCRRIGNSLANANSQLMASAESALAAAAWARSQETLPALEVIAKQFNCDALVLAGWFEYLGISAENSYRLEGHLSRTVAGASGYDFVSGWVGDDALSVVANASDTHVRIPGNMLPHSVAVHPSPSVQVVIGWVSPIAGTVKISGSVQHAHPECGNGVVWALQLRRGATRQNLATGVAHGSTIYPIELSETVAVGKTDVLCLVIGPRDGNHSCDLTAVNLRIEQSGEGASQSVSRNWDLAKDVSSDILAGNPHRDSYGNESVWHFCGEPVAGQIGPVIPAGSLLAAWQSSSGPAERTQLASQLQVLLNGAELDELAAASEADRQLVSQLRSLGGPLMGPALRQTLTQLEQLAEPGESKIAVAAERFGKRVSGEIGEPTSLYVQAPNVEVIRIPRSLVEGTEFVVTGLLAAGTEAEGSVQLQVSNQPPQGLGLVPAETEQRTVSGTWSDNNQRVSSRQPVIVGDSSRARIRLEHSMQVFRDLFPAALCYSKIVPVDEVVTLTLYHREDEALRRLVLSDDDTATLDRLWNELHFVSRDALALVDAYEQLWQYATQDADPSAFEPLRQPILDRAERFKQLEIEAQPLHLAAVVSLCADAFRRPLTDEEEDDIRLLYQQIRAADVDHEAAIRLLVARILVSPAFLYRMEQGVGPVRVIADGEVHLRRLSDHELAVRLSYFLTSSPPDKLLREAATKGELSDREGLQDHVARLLSSEQVRHMATEFACQWLQIYEFSEHDEKSETVFPEFAPLRDAMYEEAIRYWVNLIHEDRSVLELFFADYAIVNEQLAAHYGIEIDSQQKPADVQGNDAWVRVGVGGEGSRGGVLTMAAILAKQSGASRTSPILRGNWVSEVLLGDKLPRPPLNVPVLPETAPPGLNERQLIEQHSSDPACAKCHLKIDPFGFAMEGYDAIGRRRDAAAHDTSTVLFDGTKVSDVSDLKKYLVTQRRDDLVRQFCRKLLGYALGRAVQLSDQPLLDRMAEELASHDYRVSDAIQAIVHSEQFQHVRVDSIGE